MKPPRSDTPIAATLRFLFEVFFLFAFWRHWGWAVAIAAALVIVTTGVQGDKRRILVPISGSVRVVLELALTVLGLWATFRLFGAVWGIVITIVHLLYLAMSLRRFRWLASLH